jgi:hypothetical protein
MTPDKSILNSTELKSIFESYFTRNYRNVVEITGVKAKSDVELNRLLLDAESHILKIDRELTLEKIWFVETLRRDVDDKMLPYLPHIDKKRYVKVMVYVDDVTIEDGAFWVCKRLPHDFEEFRISLPENYKKNQLNLIENIPETDFFPVLGDAGSLIVFDTNTPHYAGRVLEGRSRRVIRFDYSKPEWNKISLFKRIVSKFVR